MDQLDRRLISLLRTDARMAVSNIAQELGVSRATVNARITKLLDSGVIQGFTITTANPDQSGVRAIMMVEVDGQAAEQVFRRLRGFPEIRTLYSTNGRWDIVAELETPDLQSFDETLRRIRDIDGIALTETSILLASRKKV